MKSLDKRVLRILKNDLGKYIAIFILLCLTVAFGSATLVVSDSIERTLIKNQEEQHIEDGNFTLQYPHDFNDKNIEENFYINLKDKNTLRVYKNRIYINQLSVFEGKIANSLDEISLDRTFAASNKIKVGDTITYNKNKFKVVGLVSVPDCTSLFEDNDDLMLNTIDFGIGFVTADTFDKLDDGYNVIYNYSFIGDKDEIKQRLIDDKLKIERFLPRELNQSIVFLERDMGSDVPMMKVLIYIIIAIIAFVFVVISVNNIERDAKSIGTLKAIGYRNHEIIIHYIKLPIIITLIGTLIGNILAYTIFIEPFKSIFYTTYSLPPLDVSLNYESFILLTVIPIILVIAINYVTLYAKIN